MVKTDRSYNSIYILGLVLIAVFFMLAVNSWNPKSCFIPDELFYYKSSQTLANPENVFAPKYYDEPRFQKPPIFYMAVYSAMQIFGVNWFSVRLTSILSSIAVLLFTYMIGLRMFDEKKALFSAAILATSTLFFRFGRMAVPEMLLVSCMTGAFYFAYRYFTENIGRYFYTAFILMGIGALVKGPIAIFLPVVAMAVFYRAYGPSKPTPFIRWVYGVCIAVGLGLLWFIPTIILHGHYFIDHIKQAEISDRFTAGSHSIEWSGAIFYYLQKLFFYFPIVIAEFMPWSVIGPAVFLFNKESVDKKKNNTGRLFLIIWAATGFVIFSLMPSKRVHYVLSFFPAISLYLASLFDFEKKKIKEIFTGVAAITACVYILSAVFIFPVIFSDGVDRLSARLKDLAGSPEDKVGVSWNLGPQKVELYLDRRTYIIPEHEFSEEKLPELDVAWILVGAEEYNKYFFPDMPPAEKIKRGFPTILVIAEDWRWRKKIPFQKCISDIKRRPADAVSSLRDALQERVYLLRMEK
ncbi:MAG: glycosyltransferase family 39 protein [Candidatus Omnitrophica bacterium]|nr:glycosyltransferase family 39 protein [Candidatus Omnitrophota bacterium]